MTAATQTPPPLDEAVAQAVALFPPMSDEAKDSVAYLLRAGE